MNICLLFFEVILLKLFSQNRKWAVQCSLLNNFQQQLILHLLLFFPTRVVFVIHLIARGARQPQSAKPDYCSLISRSLKDTIVSPVPGSVPVTDSSGLCLGIIRFVFCIALLTVTMQNRSHPAFCRWNERCLGVSKTPWFPAVTLSVQIDVHLSAD